MLLCYGSLQAQELTPQQQFEKANQLYQQNKYSEAAGIYQQLINQGYPLPDLYFNAGNAYYKSNRTGMAVYNYEKVLQLDPGHEAAAHNLALVNQRVQGFTEELPLLFFQKWWLQWEHLHSTNGWVIGSILLFWILIAGILGYLLTERFATRLVRVGIGVIAVLTVIYCFMSIYTYSMANSHDLGIVMASGIKAKPGPDQGGKDLFELHEGMKVEVLDATEDYCKVQLADGKTGWVACNEVKRL
jgi:tetratricopeptide (TPR) repeat protein